MYFYRPVFAFFALAGTALAAPVSLSVEEAGGYALKHNQTLAAARLRIEEARGRLEQSGRLSNPDLQVSLSRNFRETEGSVTVGLVQRFPLTARLRFEKAVSRAELAAAIQEIEDQERRLAAEARIAAIRLVALRGQRDLRAKQLANSRSLSEFLNRRVASGEASQVDASLVDLEMRQIEMETLSINADETNLVGEMRPLLGIKGDAAIIVTGSLSPGVIPSLRKTANRPDIRAAESRAEAAAQQLRQQRAMRWEDIGIGTNYTNEREIDAPEGAETNRIVGLNFSLPLPIWNNNSGRIREAQAARARAEKEVDAARLNANAEVIAAIASMRTYSKLIAEFDEKVLPAASRIEEQLRSNFNSGLTPLIEVLRSRTRRLDLERQRLDAIRDFHLARIRYSAAIGQPKPKTSSYK